MSFRQEPPRLGNQYETDPALRSYLKRALPPEVLEEVEPELLELGELAGGELYRMQLADRLNEPRLTQWDAWGERVDRIEVSPLWRVAERLAAERGLVAAAYERRHGAHSRVHQFALAYLFTPSTDIYSCPLAMTDGAARVLATSGNDLLVRDVLPRLTSRDPAQFWTSGQWMTELTGGSDVGASETVARRDGGGAWRLYGRKWFTSAAASQAALTLARPEGNPAGGRGLALFFVETRDAEGRLRNIRVDRLKDKLGTRKVPTAELTLEGTPAVLVKGTTDGAARVLATSGNDLLVRDVLPRLTSRDPAQFWTSGQWMTELTGGSDVGASETVARRDAGGAWRLYGRKWFTSAAASQAALTLARPEGNPAGGRGLALFFVETRDEEGRLRNIRVDRLKDKLGTRKVPTAELTLEGTPAVLVKGTTDGVRDIAPMLNVTRLWNAVSAAALMRRGVALARDYARRRSAFGSTLAEKPLHADTLAGLQAEAEAALHLAFYAAELTGREEAGELDESGQRLLRLLTPLVKLTTARAAVRVAGEAIEAFGGAGYVEDTGLPVILRDSQVLSIWEGTTNVLSLDALRTALKDEAALSSLKTEIESCAAAAHDPSLAHAARAAREAAAHAYAWLDAAARGGQAALEAGARRFSMTAGRALALALLTRQAQWSLEHERDPRAAAAARRFAHSAIDLISDPDPADTAALLSE